MRHLSSGEVKNEVTETAATSGVRVPAICNASRRRVALMKMAKMGPRPMTHSHAARNGTETLAGTRPKLNTPTVRAARSDAGLMPGKNFRMPNQKNTPPRLIRSNDRP